MHERKVRLYFEILENDSSFNDVDFYLLVTSKKKFFLNLKQALRERLKTNRASSFDEGFSYTNGIRSNYKTRNYFFKKESLPGSYANQNITELTFYSYFSGKSLLPNYGLIIPLGPLLNFSTCLVQIPIIIVFPKLKRVKDYIEERKLSKNPLYNSIHDIAYKNWTKRNNSTCIYDYGILDKKLEQELTLCFLKELKTYLSNIPKYYSLKRRDINRSYKIIELFLKGYTSL